MPQNRFIALICAVVIPFSACSADMMRTAAPATADRAPASGEDVLGALEGSLTALELELLDWNARLSLALVTGPEGDGPTDMEIRWTPLGEWLASNERAQAEERAPGLIPLVRELGEQHSRLLNSAARIAALYSHTDPHLGAFLRDAKADILAWTHRVQDVFVDLSLNWLVNVEMDPERTAFGRWFYSEESAHLLREHPELEPILGGIEEPHRRLYESARVIEQLLAEDRRDEAATYYLANTRSLASEALAGIDELVAWHDTRLERLRQARAIYAGETSPALQQIRELLHRMREVVAGHRR